MSLNTADTFLYCKSVVDPLLGLLTYSHIVPTIVSILIGFFILYSSKERLSAWILFLLGVTFSTWSFLDLSIWTHFDNESLVMFHWSLINLFDVLFYILSLYFVYVFLTKKDVSFYVKIIWFALLVPIMYSIFSGNDLSGFYLPECYSLEYGWYTTYIFSVEVLVSLWIIVLTLFYLFKNLKDKFVLKEISLLVLGMMIFLFSFFGAGLYSDMTGDYKFEQFGLFGMVVFMAILAYLVVELKLFKVKLIATQALVVTLIILIGSQFLFIQNNINKVLNSITLVLSIGFGYLLVKSVKREIEAKEKVEKLAGELEQANIQQESLIRFISHEMKGYLTTSAGVFASIVEGDFNPISDMLKSSAESALAKVREGVRSVVEILSNANAKKGTLAYNMQAFDLGTVVLESIAKLAPDAKEKGIALETAVTADGTCRVMGDASQLSEHVVRNLIDNSIKYTPSGSVHVELSKQAGKVLLSIRDTGVGITPEDKVRLFTEGGRGKDSLLVNVHSTGYGLAIAKKIVDAHSGRIWAESEGKGKGSQFYVELPEAK